MKPNLRLHLYTFPLHTSTFNRFRTNAILEKEALVDREVKKTIYIYLQYYRLEECLYLKKKKKTTLSVDIFIVSI